MKQRARQMRNTVLVPSAESVLEAKHRQSPIRGEYQRLRHAVRTGGSDETTAPPRQKNRISKGEAARDLRITKELLKSMFLRACSK